MALWKQPKREGSCWDGKCGAEMKTGMLLPEPPRCVRRPGHFGDHEASTEIRWPRTADEVAELLTNLDRPGADL